MSNHYDIKQVILMRTDLKNTQGNKVRSGKLMAQAAHAAMLWLSSRLEWSTLGHTAGAWFSSAEHEWLTGSFAKIVLGVDSEQQLRDLCEKAFIAGLVTEMCTDNGSTEFGGVATVTCGAIGPAKAEDIDKITGHLKPL